MTELSQQIKYCPYCGSRVNPKKMLDSFEEYYCTIDNRYCVGETCTLNFKEKCMYLGRKYAD